MGSSKRARAVGGGVIAVALGCGAVPSASPVGDALAAWPSPAPLRWSSSGKSGVMPKEVQYGRSVDPPLPHVSRFSLPAGGATVEVRWSTGSVVFPETPDFKGSAGPRRSLVTGEVVLADNAGGWKVDATFSDSASRLAGDPPDVLAAYVWVRFTRGHRGCGKVTFDNEEMTLVLHGDGTAALAPTPPTSGLSASASAPLPR